MKNQNTVYSKDILEIVKIIERLAYCESISIDDKKEYLESFLEPMIRSNWKIVKFNAHALLTCYFEFQKMDYFESDLILNCFENLVKIKKVSDLSLQVKILRNSRILNGCLKRKWSFESVNKRRNKDFGKKNISK